MIHYYVILVKPSSSNVLELPAFHFVEHYTTTVTIYLSNYFHESYYMSHTNHDVIITQYSIRKSPVQTFSKFQIHHVIPNKNLLRNICYVILNSSQYSINSIILRNQNQLDQFKRIILNLFNNEFI